MLRLEVSFTVLFLLTGGNSQRDEVLFDYFFLIDEAQVLSPKFAGICLKHPTTQIA